MAEIPKAVSLTVVLQTAVLAHTESRLQLCWGIRFIGHAVSETFTAECMHWFYA